MITRRRIAALTAAAVLALSSGTTSAHGQDTAAVAINTKDGSALFRLAFSVRRVMTDVVDETNAAVAYASCEECQTIAIALQLVLVMGDADIVAPTNLALAINEQCTGCETLASAYQFVFGTGEPVRFTADGNRRLAELRERLQRLRSSELSLTEVQAEVEQITNELEQVVADELVAAGTPDSPDEGATTTSSSTTSSVPEESTTTSSDPTTTTTAESTTTTTTEPTG
jgi:putative peptide zinc metalloprotease protein